MRELKITLGAKHFEVGKLRLRQLRDLEIGVIKLKEEQPSLEATTRLVYDRAVEIIAKALEFKFPDMTADAIFDMEGVTAADVNRAAVDILRFAGLILGEAEAAASTGGSHTPT